MKLRAALVLLPLTLSACNLLDDAKKPAEDTKAVGSAPGAAVAATPSGKVGAFAFQKLAVGQFVEYRNGAKRYGWAIVGAQDGGLWLELAADVDGQPMVMQMLVDIADGSQIHRAKPKKMKFKIPGRGVQEVDGAMLAMGDKMRSQGTFLLDMSAEQINQGKREDVAVPAGKFSGALRWQGSTKNGAATFWSHASVPITGVVKGTDPAGTWELTKYGMTGAKSEL